MSPQEKLPVTVLCGFLGSGKTRLLRRWRSDEALHDAAFIIHDLSDFGVDVELVADEKSRPKPGHLVDRVAALHGAHARDQLHASVGRVLGEIADLDPAPPHVLCESTGAARPWPLIAALAQDERFQLRHFIVTVDALNLHRDFADGRVFTGEAIPSGDAALLRAAEILAEQFGLTLNTPTAEDVEAIILRDPRPFHPERLHDACQNQLGTGMYRTKGFLWLASRSSEVLLWQQSGSQIVLELSGFWAAEADQDGNMLPEEIEYLKQRLQAAHPLFGDRNNELTLIGLPSACTAFAAALQGALCTEEEIAAWQRGEVFADPWPRNLRKID